MYIVVRRYYFCYGMTTSIVYSSRSEKAAEKRRNELSLVDSYRVHSFSVVHIPAGEQETEISTFEE